MQFTKLILLTIISVCCISTIKSQYRYKIDLPENFGICPGQESAGIHKIINTTAYTLNPETARANGSLIFIKKLSPLLPLRLQATIAQNILGQWVRHPSTIDFPNVCTVLYSKQSEWYSITKHWTTPETRTCPFIQNHPYPINNVKVKTVFNMALKVSTGEYLITLILSQPGVFSSCCTFALDVSEYNDEDEDDVENDDN